MYRIIRTKTITEIYYYRNSSKISKTDSVESLLPADKQSRKNKTNKERHDNWHRSKNAIRRIADINFNAASTFFTLTFAKNEQEIELANHEFKKFIQRMRHKYGQKWKYLAVPEYQKRGAVHYHVLATRRFPWKELRTIWGHGNIDIGMIKHVKAIGAYVSKYFTKQTNKKIPPYKKKYWCSRNIEMPVIIRQAETPREIIGVKPIYSRSFMSDYHGEINYVIYSNKHLNLVKPKHATIPS